MEKQPAQEKNLQILTVGNPQWKAQAGHYSAMVLQFFFILGPLYILKSYSVPQRAFKLWIIYI